MRFSKNVLGVFVLFALFVVAVSSCKKDKDEEVTPESTFDKPGMLTNYADSIILPQYQQFKQKIDSLKLLADAFVAAPNLSNLPVLQSHFLSTYEQYQWISTFEFGPAETDVLRANFNTFPCDTTQINTNIVAGSYDLSTVSNIDAKGFPALDFLLFGIQQDDNYILSLYTTSPTAVNAKNYLSDLVDELQLKSNNVYNAWLQSGGNYISTFKNSTGSDVGSSIGMLVNQLNFDFELLKNARIGIPLGKRTLGVPLPEKVEAYYSQHSIELIMEHIQNIENVYLGRSISNNDGLGLDDYLSHINAQYAGGSLNDAIKAKFTSAKAKLLLIPGTLSQAVVTDATIVDQAYAELLQLVVLLKVDMPSALGVLITYQDNDGD
ncbi:MAG: imelysin family protein [Bacteroidetes bacterium]|nr:imelysin family protein [Bacteroidota bacterium]